MADFISHDPNAVKMLSEELERKIEEVNSSMVDARNKAENFQGIKNKLDGEIRDLEEVKKSLQLQIPPLQSEKDSLLAELQELKDSIESQKAEVADLRKQTSEAKQAREQEAQKATADKEEMIKRKSDLDGQESILKIYAKGLEEKEKKLDVYADRVKKLLDSVKNE